MEIFEKDKLTYPSIVGIENSKVRAFDLAKEAKEKHVANI